MAEFARLRTGDGYPRKDYSASEDQSYGFTPAYKLQTGNLRGTQTVGYGGAKIDGANNRIIVTNPDDNTSIGLGTIPGTTNEFGFFALNDNDELVYKNVMGTQYYYNPQDELNNSIIIGGAPDDGRTGIWVGRDDENVDELLGA